jgi:hypothetical protein
LVRKNQCAKGGEEINFSFHNFKSRKIQQQSVYTLEQDPNYGDVLKIYSVDDSGYLADLLDRYLHNQLFDVGSEARQVDLGRMDVYAVANGFRLNQYGRGFESRILVSGRKNTLGQVNLWIYGKKLVFHIEEELMRSQFKNAMATLQTRMIDEKTAAIDIMIKQKDQDMLIKTVRILISRALPFRGNQEAVQASQRKQSLVQTFLAWRNREKTNLRITHSFALPDGPREDFRPSVWENISGDQGLYRLLLAIAWHVKKHALSVVPVGDPSQFSVASRKDGWRIKGGENGLREILSVIKVPGFSGFLSDSVIDALIFKIKIGCFPVKQLPIIGPGKRGSRDLELMLLINRHQDKIMAAVTLKQVAKIIGVHRSVIGRFLIKYPEFRQRFPAFQKGTKGKPKTDLAALIDSHKEELSKARSLKEASRILGVGRSRLREARRIHPEYNLPVWVRTFLAPLP